MGILSRWLRKYILDLLPWSVWCVSDVLLYLLLCSLVCLVALALVLDVRTSCLLLIVAHILRRFVEVGAGMLKF